MEPSGGSREPHSDMHDASDCLNVKYVLVSYPRVLAYLCSVLEASACQLVDVLVRSVHAVRCNRKCTVSAKPIKTRACNIG